MKNIFGNYLDTVFLVSLLFIPFIPNFGRIEIIGPQFLFMSGCIVSYLILKILNKQSLDFKLSYGNLSYLGFLIFAFISISKAFNIPSSLIELARFITIFTYLIFIYSILEKNQYKIDKIIYFILAFMSIETGYILYIFIDFFDFYNPPFRLREFEGLAYNQNVASLSILAKIPFIFYFLFRNNRILFKIILYILLFVSVFDISIIASRSALYGIILFSSILLASLLIRKRLNLKFLKVKTVGSIIFIFFCAGILNIYLFQNSDKAIDIVERSLNVQEESTNYRLNLWEDSLDMIKQNPVFGVGIGNYKIKSLEYGKDLLKDYTIPFHAHNDFLQIFVETGMFGALFYLLFFILPFVLFVFHRKKISTDNQRLAFFLIISIIAIIIDSFFNFPKYRPYSLINLIIVFSLFYNLYNENNDISIKKFWLFFILGVNICSFYLLNRSNNSLKEQYPIYVEYNYHQDKIITPIKDILKFEDEIPNITTLTIPIKIAKARYLFLDGQYHEAKTLIKKGQKHNPYLGIGDNILARIYLREKKLDSALYYAKKSVEKLPNNLLHITYYQIILERLGDIDEANRFFEEKKHIENETIWQNYTIGITSFKTKNKLDYTEKEVENIKRALELFPNSQLIKAANKLVDYEGTLFSIVDELDIKAYNYFTNKEYEQAIENWLRASEFIKDEDSYLLNIAHSYLLMDKLDKTVEYLKLIEQNELKSVDGKYEFLLSALYLKRGNVMKACEFAKISVKKGYKSSSSLLKAAKCSSY